MIRFFSRNRNRWLIMALVFGIGPLACYLLFISPAIGRISEYQKQVSAHANGTGTINSGPAPTTDQELQQLEDIKHTRLARIKKIGSRESLLNFSGTLADALAMQARDYGLKVINVDLQNALIKGRYVPGNNHALDLLAGLPGLQWKDLADPLALPMLNLPAVDISMTVAADYSEVFTFIDSLPEFPSPVSLSSLSTVDDVAGRAYQMKIRGFYYRNSGTEQVAQLDQTTSP
jgi:hypothetical protein